MSFQFAGNPFELGGDADAIRASAARWRSFADKASGASSRIGRMDASQFVGPEGDEYRSALNHDMRPHLDRTAQAWTTVQHALFRYADTLADLQARMAPLAAKAQSQQDALSSAKSELDRSRNADFRNTPLGSGTTATPASADTYHSHTAALSGDLSDAKRALQSTVDAANKLQAEHDSALDRCCEAIDAAKHLRFAKPPGWFSRTLHSVGHWVSEHAGALLKISAVLKQISAISGMLALIPIEPFQAICLAVSVGTGLVAMGIDVAVKLSTGKGSWTQIGIDGLGLIPGAKALRAGQEISKGLKIARAVQTYAPKVAVTGLTAYQVATGQASWADLAFAAAGVSQNKKLGILTVYAHAGYDGYDLASNKNRSWEDYVTTATSIGSAGLTHRYNMRDIREQQAADRAADKGQHRRNEPPPERWTQPDTEAARNAVNRYVERHSPSVNGLLDRSQASVDRVLDHPNSIDRVLDGQDHTAHAVGNHSRTAGNHSHPVLNHQDASAASIMSHVNQSARNLPSPSMS